MGKKANFNKTNFCNKAKFNQTNFYNKTIDNLGIFIINKMTNHSVTNKMTIFLLIKCGITCY